MATESNKQTDVIDLKDILGTILNHKWLILCVTLIFTIGGFVYTKLRIPNYETNLLISIATDGGSGSDLGSIISNVAPMMSGQSSEAQKQIDIIKSRSVLEPVIKKLQLDISIRPNYFPIIGRKIAYSYGRTNYLDKPNDPKFGLSSYSWGGEYVTLNHLDVSNPWKMRQFMLVYSGGDHYQLLDQQGQILIKGQFGQDEAFQVNPKEYIKINIDHITAFPGTEFTLSQSYMSDAIANVASKLSISETDKRSNLLKLSYKGSNPVRITQILNAIGHSAVDSEIERKARNADQVLKFLRKQLPDVQKHLEAAETKLNNYRSESGNISISAGTQIVLEQLSGYDTKIAELELKKAQLAEKLTVNNPELIQAENTIKQLKKQKQEVEAEIKKLPKSDQIALNFMREAEVQSKIYQNILQRIQQYEILKVGTLGSLELIDSASIPYKPIDKPAKLIIALAFILGLFLSIAWVFVRNYLFRGIEDPDVIEEEFGLKIFGSLHKSKLHQKQEKKLSKGLIQQMQLINEVDPHDLTVEGLRSLRTNILFHLASTNNNVISITGPIPNVGKSFASAHLAHILVESGKKVLLVDADLRKGDVYRYFMPKAGQGLIEYLKGKINIKDVIQKTKFPGLDLISSGQLGTKHIGLLSKVDLNSMIESIAKDYDVVVIDNAPILAVTDATEFMRVSGLNLLILASGRHDDREVKLTMKRLNSAGINVDGFIFNLVEVSHSYYGNKYKYKYTYSKK